MFVRMGLTSVSIPADPIDLATTSASCSNVLKMLHHYLTLMKAVPTLATDAFHGMVELVEFYGYSA
jgi:hypothetical protein